MNDELADIDRWVTVGMLAAHVGRHQRSITRAIKYGNLRASKSKGIRGHRIKLRNANEFIRKVYPEVKPLS